jgi:hypothetical protein
MRLHALIAVSALLLLTPALGESQVVSEVMSGIQNGGGWVEVPIQDGRGSMSTMTLPTVGLTLAGCITIWPGHSGSWELEAHDRISNSVLEVTAEPGVGELFSHTFGMQAQIDFDFRWSEARDTTLLMWVGLNMGGVGQEESCAPRYAGG